MRPQSEPGKCPVCGSSDVMQIATGLPRAMRSDGLTVEAPLRKTHCFSCDSAFSPALCEAVAKIPYRRTDGSSLYEIKRHQEVVKGLVAFTENVLRNHQTHLAYPPRSILEVGSASGKSLCALGAIWPHAQLTGIDPSPEEILRPEPDGRKESVIHFLQCTLGNYAQMGRQHDLVFANHVIEHADDIRAFIQGLAKVVTKRGVIVLACPRGDICSFDLLFSDHHYHLSVRGMQGLLREMGLSLVGHGIAPWDRESRCFVIANAFNNVPEPLDKGRPDSLLSARSAYFAAWAQLDERLQKRASCANLTLFGGGETSQLLFAYAPQAGQKVGEIVVDHMEGMRHFDRPVRLLDAHIPAGSKLLLGVHPRSQKILEARIREKIRCDMVEWHDLIPE